LLKQHENEPVPLDGRAEELLLSRADLTGLLRSIVDKGLPFRFRAGGFSMIPMIRDGDVITVFPLKRRLPRLGDVLAYAHPASDCLVVHRMIGKRDIKYLLKGDNAILPDVLIPRENILGHVKKVERNRSTVWLGLGLERFLIAFFTRINFNLLVRHPLKNLARLLARR
jgi:hypothetical protein